MTNKEFQILKQQRDAKLGVILTKIIDTEWNRVSRQLDALDTDSGDVTKAAILVGQYQILDKLMEALSVINIEVGVKRAELVSLS